MCGILTVIDKQGTGLDLPACRRALSAMNWRGPDKCISHVWGGRVFMGQTILSLTGDISESEKNHLRSRSGRYHLAYNGEIYNFKEIAGGDVQAQTTDSEVLVNLHDRLAVEDVPAGLDGMYAYALLDDKEETLTLARDIQGEKSLYIYEDDRRIILSSEIRAILSLEPKARLDEQALRDYFRTRHLLLFDRTIYQDIRQLPPGSVEQFDLKTHSWKTLRRRTIREWIDPARMELCGSRTLEDLADELDALLRTCIRQMLPEGRKYAAVVSGGVDSSLIARHVVSQGSPDLLIAVNHKGKDLISNDLRGFEKKLGREIVTLDVDLAPYSKEIENCQKACGAPLPSHSFVAQALQSARVQAAGCRVLFGGDAADEIFGGYSAYRAGPVTPTDYCPSPYSGHGDPELDFKTDSPARIQAELGAAWKDSLDAYAFVPDAGSRIRLAMMYCDAAYQVPAVGLRGADLMSMMWSVEARTAFIRRPIVEFALNLPLRAKVDDLPGTDDLMRTKILLKILFQRHYGRELLQKKQGFAGFPNESARFLGDPADFLAHSLLGSSPNGKALSRDASWKLANIEYFLRHRGVW